MPGSNTLSPLARLREAAEELGPLPGLSGEGYAAAHALFEARSDQRALVVAWLRDRLAARAATAQPVSVLAVGCGDGSVDVHLADLLTSRDPARPVRYLGLDPHGPSATAFAARLAGLHRVGLVEDALATTFAAAPPLETPPWDVVTFVHSLYYVPDVTVALRSALALLAPGGEVLVLAAPQGPLNALAAALAPPVTGGHPQWWSSTVAAAVDGLVVAGAVASSRGRLAGRLDLTGCDDAHDPAAREVLDFTVQARLPVALRPAVLAHLRAIALPGPGLVVDHPLDSWVLRRT